MEWVLTRDRVPPEGVEVDTKIDDDSTEFQSVRNEQRLVRKGRLWFAGDMYVYYEPTHWRFF